MPFGSQEFQAGAAALAEALATPPTAVAVFAASGRLISATTNLAAVLELPSPPAPGQELAAVLGPLAAELPPPPAKRRCRAPGGGMLDLALLPLTDGGVVLRVCDVSSAEAANAAAEAERAHVETAARAKALFLATVSHELRTPLNAVIGFSEALAFDAARKHPPLDSGQVAEFAGHILEAGQHLLGLIDDLLDFVRLDSGALQLAADTVDIGRIVAVMAQRQQAAAAAAAVRLTVHDGAPGLSVTADERRLRRLLAHLLGNAIKFTPAGGSVTVTTGRSPGGAPRIVIADNGIGMAPEDLRRLREPFQQHDASFTRRAGGAGMGLPLSRAIAAAHGGKLELESRPGGGTTVTVDLPAARIIGPLSSDRPAKDAC